MGSLKKYWTAWQNFRISNSEPRRVLINLSQAFADAIDNVPAADLLRIPANNNMPGLYSIYACTKNLELAGSKHGFLRFVNPNGEIECDIHGVKKVNPSGKGDGTLSAIIEPKDFEHFSHMKDNAPVLLWQGTAAEAGDKMRRAIALVDRVDEMQHPYRLLSRNCNTLLHSLLEVMDIKLPRAIPSWSPGISHILQTDVDFVRTQRKTDDAQSNANWLSGFIDRLTEERKAIIEKFGDLSRAAFASSAVFMPQRA